jgi:hypothetical protein
MVFKRSEEEQAVERGDNEDAGDGGGSVSGDHRA